MLSKALDRRFLHSINPNVCHARIYADSVEFTNVLTYFSLRHFAPNRMTLSLWVQSAVEDFIEVILDDL